MAHFSCLHCPLSSWDISKATHGIYWWTYPPPPKPDYNFLGGGAMLHSSQPVPLQGTEQILKHLLRCVSIDMDTHPKKKALVNLRSSLQRKADVFNRSIWQLQLMYNIGDILPTFTWSFFALLYHYFLSVFMYLTPLYCLSFQTSLLLNLGTLNIFKFKRNMSHRFTKTLLNHWIKTIYYTSLLALLGFLDTVGSQPSNKENRHWLLTHGEGFEHWQRDAPFILVPSAPAPVTYEFNWHSHPGLSHTLLYVTWYNLPIGMIFPQIVKLRLR